jgi:biopolymer transport protein ExbB/TolQ
MIDRYRLFKAMASSGDAKKQVSQAPWAELQSWAAQQAKQGNIPARTTHAALTLGGRNPEAIDRAVKSSLTEERARLEKGLTVLATLGSNAPFIGLFGTVLGIIEAFGQLSSQQSNTQAVIGGVSEALVATAVGLFVAIPAVVAYNVFGKAAKAIATEAEVLRDLLVARILTEEKGR